MVENQNQEKKGRGGAVLTDIKVEIGAPQTIETGKNLDIRAEIEAK